MSDPERAGAGPDAGTDGGTDGEVRTGVARVDAVIAAVEELEGRPVEEHAAVFEAAQDALRRALDQDPGRPAHQPGRRAPS